MKNGFIKLHKKILDWEWYSDTNVMRLFLHCLFKANWQDKPWHGQIIKRGSFVTSLKHLADETRLSVKQIRIALDKLNLTGELVTKGANKFTLVTVVKYNDYQCNDTTEGNQRANKGQTKGKQRATTKESKNLKNLKKVSIKEKIGFEELQISDISDWLNEKRTSGKYMMIDEQELLEMFKDYCRSKTPNYKDYVAAFRNSFKWSNAPTKVNHQQRTQADDWNV